MGSAEYTMTGVHRAQELDVLPVHPGLVKPVRQVEVIMVLLLGDKVLGFLDCWTGTLGLDHKFIETAKICHQAPGVLLDLGHNHRGGEELRPDPQLLRVGEDAPLLELVHLLTQQLLHVGGQVLGVDPLVGSWPGSEVNAVVNMTLVAVVAARVRPDDVLELLTQPLEVIPILLAQLVVRVDLDLVSVVHRPELGVDRCLVLVLVGVGVVHSAHPVAYDVLDIYLLHKHQLPKSLALLQEYR